MKVELRPVALLVKILRWRVCARVVWSFMPEGAATVVAARDAPDAWHEEIPCAGGKARVEVFSGVCTASSLVAVDQGRIILYRSLDDGFVAGATTVFIHGVHHPSLISGGFSDPCLRPRSVRRLAGRGRGLTGSSPDERGALTRIDVETGAIATHFLAMIDDQYREGAL